MTYHPSSRKAVLLAAAEPVELALPNFEAAAYACSRIATSLGWGGGLVGIFEHTDQAACAAKQEWLEKMGKSIATLLDQIATFAVALSTLQALLPRPSRAATQRPEGLQGAADILSEASSGIDSASSYLAMAFQITQTSLAIGRATLGASANEARSAARLFDQAISDISSPLTETDVAFLQLAASKVGRAIDILRAE